MNSANIKAAGLMLLAMFVLTINDTAAKLASENLSVSQLLFLRGCIAIPLFALYLLLIKQPVFSPDIAHPKCILRGMCEVGATSCFIYALSQAPLALASALLWLSPIFVTVLAATFLREKVSVGHWLAVVTGFSGVLFITQPFGKAFEPALFFSVGAAVFIAVRDLTTAKLPERIHTAHVTFAATILVTLFSALIAIPNWQPPAGREVGLLTLSAILLNASFLLHINSIRLGELSFVALFTFSNIIFALLLGYLIWGDQPNYLMLFGIFLIVCACTYLFRSKPVQA